MLLNEDTALIASCAANCSKALGKDSAIISRGGSRIDGRGVLRLLKTCASARDFFVPRPFLTSYPRT